MSEVGTMYPLILMTIIAIVRLEAQNGSIVILYVTLRVYSS